MSVFIIGVVLVLVFAGVFWVRWYREGVRLKEKYPATYAVSYSRVSNNYRSTDGLWTVVFKIITSTESGVVSARSGIGYGGTLNSSLREAKRKIRRARKDMDNIRRAAEMKGGVI